MAQAKHTDTNTDTSTDTGTNTDIGHLPGLDVSKGIDIKELLALTVQMMQSQKTPSTFGVELNEKEKEALAWLRKQANYDPAAKGRQPWKSYQRGYEKFEGQGAEYIAFEPRRGEKVGYIPLACEKTAPEAIQLLAAKQVTFTSVIISRLKTHGMVKIGALMMVCKETGYAPKTQTQIVDVIRKSVPFYPFRFDETGELQLKPGEEIPDFIGWKTFAELFDVWVNPAS